MLWSDEQGSWTLSIKMGSILQSVRSSYIWRQPLYHQWPCPTNLLYHQWPCSTNCCGNKVHSSLHFAFSDCGPFAAVSQLRCFGCNLLKDIIYKTICDTHCLETNSCMYLCQDPVNVYSIILLSLLVIPFKDIFLGLHCLLGWYFQQPGGSVVHLLSVLLTYFQHQWNRRYIF